MANNPVVNRIGDGQTKLNLQLQTNIDISSDVPTTVEIYAWNPDNVNEPLLNTNKDETWTASIVAGSETDGVIEYALLTTDPLARGTWSFRAAMTYGDSRVVYTKMVKLVVGN
jgi:hypothetical protein